MRRTTAIIDTRHDEVRVLPIQTVGRNVLLSGAFSLVPVFAALLWLTSASAGWPVIALSEIVVAAAVLTVYLRLRMVQVTVTADEFIKVGMAPRTRRVARDDITRVDLTRVYRNHSSETMLHLLGFDGAGRVVVRLSGLWWPEEAIVKVADAFEVDEDDEERPLSKGEYLDLVPGARTWWQRRVVTSVTVIVITAAVGVAVFVLQGLSMRA